MSERAQEAQAVNINIELMQGWADLIRRVDDLEGERDSLRRENARLLRNWDAQIVGDTKARQTLCEQSDRYLAERDGLRSDLREWRARVEAHPADLATREMVIEMVDFILARGQR